MTKVAIETASSAASVETSSATIPACEPVIGQRELEYVTECLRTGWVSSAGQFIDEFENRWAAYCGRRYGVAMSNGTTALQAAVAALDLEPGDEVIMPTFTIVSCAQAVTYNGGRPVLVDCDPETWCMDVAQVEAAVSSRTRAIMPVHIYGHPVDMDPIVRLAQEHGLAVIEDAAEAHGAEYLSDRLSSSPTWQRCGSMGTASAFSFYANKLITTGEGGMLLTDDEELFERARAIRNMCFGRGDERFRHISLGHNFRMTNVQAAMGVAQVERIDEIVARKRWIGQQYTWRLQEVEKLQLPVEREWARSVYWMYGVVVSEDTGMDGAEFARRLRQRGVDTRPFFLGMHEQPAFQEQGLFVGERHPVAERIARQGVYLPSGLTLTEADIERVIWAVREVL
jgi:perosamine synthetase